MGLTVSFVGADGEAIADETAWRMLGAGTPLVFTNEALAKFADLRARAEENVIAYDAMLKMAQDHESGRMQGAPAHCIDQTIEITFGWTVTYTVEEHQLAVPCRHLSVATPNQQRIPTRAAVEMVMAQFGFVGGVERAFCYAENLFHGGDAINVIQPMSGTMAELVHTEGSA